MEVRELSALVRQGYNERAWHGPNLRSSVRGVDVEAALWRPGPRRPCIWELVLHCAYWKHQVIGRVTGEREPFPRAGSNFPRLPAQPTAAAWKADVQLMDEVHARLMKAIHSLDSAALGVAPEGQQYARQVNLTGIMMHDVYHAGQIRLLRRLRGTKSSPKRRGKRARPAAGKGRKA